MMVTGVESASEGEDWKIGNNEKVPMVPQLWGWTMIVTLLTVQCYWVDKYTANSTFLKWGSMDIWVAYLIIQIVCIAYSWVVCSFLFERFPTIMGLPFFLLAFGPAFLICAIPFCTDFGKEFAQNAPLWVLCLWSAVRLMFESIVQCHAKFGVKGVSSWLLWPIQKAPEPYTMTYPVVNWTVTRTNGGNVDAMSSLCIGLPVALICAIVNDDENTGIKTIAWIAQIWIFFYLVAIGPVPHFLMGMPGPNNIFDGKSTPQMRTRMHALTSGTLGTCCFWIASYAVIHFLVFVRKMGKF